MATTVTSTVKSSGGDYTTLSGWESDKQADLTSTDEIQVAECYDVDDTTALTIDGWTTSATQYVSIIVNSAARHAGYWDVASNYNLIVASATAISINEEFVRIDGLQIGVTGTTGHGVNIGSISGTSDVRLSNLLLKGGPITGGGTAHVAVRLNDSGGADANVTCWNIKAWDWHNGSFPTTNNAGLSGFAIVFGNMTCYNCTAFNCSRGFHVQSGETMVVTNCYANCDEQQSNFEDFDADGTMTQTTNASSDATATGTGLDNILISGNISSITDTDTDFLALLDNELVGVGTDDPGGGLFDDDITGATRTSTWDIGADEFIAAAAGNPWYHNAQQQ